MERNNKLYFIILLINTFFDNFFSCFRNVLLFFAKRPGFNKWFFYNFIFTTTVCFLEIKLVNSIFICPQNILNG